MDNDQRIKTQYENSRGDSAKLFREILRVSKETGLDEALAILGRCVTEKRIAWAQAHLNNYRLGLLQHNYCFLHMYPNLYPLNYLQKP